MFYTVNSYLIHVFQLIPLLLATNFVTHSKPFIAYPDFISGAQAAMISGFLAFVFALGTQSTFRRFLFLIFLILLVLISLNTLVLHPAVGTFVGSVFVMILMLKPDAHFSYKRLFLTSEIPLVVAFGLASLFYALFMLNISKESEVLLFSSQLASASVIYIAFAKLKINMQIANVISVGLPLTSLYLILDSPADYHFYITSIVFLVAGIATILASFLGRSVGIRDSLNRVFARPEMIVISYFFIIAAIGCFLLQIPAAQAQSAPHSILDSFFTAMSAVCVTGLGVLDTAMDFSLMGQGIILLLIQFGGLGIVSMSAWILFVFQSKRLSVQHEQTISELSGYSNSLSPTEIIKRILVYFFSFELMGTVILFMAFRSTDSNLTALWRAVFTSVSAFCNAGFAIQSNSLVPYQSSPLVMITVGILIIAGGFAPLLALNIPAKRRFSRFSLQEKLSLITTLVLLFVGFIFFLPLEWNYSLNGLSFSDKLLNAWFQSVTTRTAGFNSIELSSMRDATSILFMVLMFVGGNPGSAAGGVKTVTAAVIFFSGLSALRADKETRAFGRTIATETVFRAIAIIGLGLTMGFMAFLMLSLTQQIATVPLLFETVSALGTVGLSMGATANLDEVGRVLITFCMLAGRVGPVTFVLLLMRRSNVNRWRLPKEDVYIS